MRSLRKQLKSGLMDFIQRQGILVARYPLQHCLRYIRPTTILDVGANVGQYGLELRSLGYRGKIHSFEPFPTAFNDLQQVAARSHPKNAWQVHQFGLGEREGEAALNVSRNSLFNSFRGPLPESTALCAGMVTSKILSVKIRTLEIVWRELNLSGERVFLKMDTQGYELPILQGGMSVMGGISGIQMEVSLTPLYKGQPCVEDIVPFLRDLGFQIFGLWPGQGLRGEHKEVYEVDVIFVRL